MKFVASTPNLFTTDLNRSLAFYRDVLGFAVTVTVPEAPPFVFALLTRDAVTLYLNDLAAARKTQPELATSASVTAGQSGVSVFLHLEGIEPFWEQVRDKAPVFMPLTTQWYGLTEFTLVDPDGYLVTFAERR